MLASGTAVSPRYDTRNPLLDSSFEEFQIYFDVTHLLALVDLLVSTYGASVAFYGGNRIYSNRGSPSLPDSRFNLRMCANEHLLALVIEI